MTNLLDQWLRKTVGDGDKNKSPEAPAVNNPAPQAPKPNPTNELTPANHHKPVEKSGAPHKPHRPSPNQNNKKTVYPFDSMDDKTRVLPIGGMEEVGRNMEAIFYKDECVLVDCGLQFPDADMFGVDYVIPDTACLEDRKTWIKALLITHGHLDHIGALPHILPKLGFPPLYGTKLTLAFAKARLEEYALDNKVEFHEVKPGEQKLKFGKHFEVEFFRVNHSIPDSAGIAITTPAGTIVHTGDFKFDFTPADGLQADFAKLAELGKRGVTLLMADSTNAEKPGHTISESVIAKNLAETIEKAKGRIIVATFSSLVGRVQHIVNAAVKTNRKIYVSGRSMIKNIELATRLGYLKIPQGLLRELKKNTNINELPANRVMILCTGSQGEELSALTRISLGDHATIKIKSGDMIVFSSTPIPGNESAVVGVTNNLLRLGANVITNRHLDVHTSGHAQQEDLKLMLALTRPKYLMPIHGELIMRDAHKKLAEQTGVAEGNVVLLDNGDLVEISPGGIVRKSKSKVRTNDIMIDGLGVGDIGTQVVRERSIMSENGVIVLIFKAYASSGKLIGEPEVVSRGFIYMKESASIVEETKKQAKKAYEEAFATGKSEFKDLRMEISRAVLRFIRQRLDREPMVLPFIVRV